MRRVVGFVLIGLGAFLVTLAPLAKWYVAPRLAVAPLGCDPGPLCDGGVSISPSTGTATTLFDPATLTAKSNVAIESVRRVKPDQAASKGDDNLTVYDSFQDVTDSTGTTIDASTERIAFNGHDSQMINCCNSNVNGTPITDFTGINPFKFPFNTGKQDYPYFDDTLSKALPMEYQGTEDVAGLTTYKFVQTIQATQFAELEVPGDLVGQPDTPAVKAPRFYQNVRTVWVEPTTGAVIKGTEQQKQFLAGADGVTEAMVIIEATIGFTDENIAESAKTAKDGKSQLDLIQQTVPLVALVLGLVLILGGVLLVRRDEESQPASGGAHTA